MNPMTEVAPRDRAAHPTAHRGLVPGQARVQAFLGDWTDRPGNHNIEEEYVAGSCAMCRWRCPDQPGTSWPGQGGRTPAGAFYDPPATRDVYDLLRYGVKVRPEAGGGAETRVAHGLEGPFARTTSPSPRR